jgi:hypothetical protein
VGVGGVRGVSDSGRVGDMQMKIEAKLDGCKLVIDTSDITDCDEILRHFAKHVAFRKYIVDNIVQRMLTDQVFDERGDWWESIGFGESYLENARMLLSQHADEVVKTQCEILQKERDNFKRFYEEYLDTCCKQKNEIMLLKCKIGRIKERYGNEVDEI